MVLAFTFSEKAGSSVVRGLSGAPRVMFHQFWRPTWSRSEARTVQNVLPMANHCAPDTREKRMGVLVRRIPA